MRKTFMRFASLLTSGSRGPHVMVKRVSLGILLAGVLIVGAGQAVANPPTAVTCGDTITAPGQYFLAGDCMGNGITIAASDVHLKLDGHTMTGGFLSPTGLLALNVSQVVSHVHIEGPGTITNYDNGIVFSQVSDSHLEQVRSVNNRLSGLTLTNSTNTHVNNNVFSMNSVGLALGSTSDDNHLNNNETIGNKVGITLQAGATSNHINGNTALGNFFFDLVDFNLNCDDNKWNGNTFGSANQSCIH